MRNRSDKPGSPDVAKWLGELLDCHAAKLVLYARQLCGEPEDAVQRAFIDLAAQQPAPDDPVAWLYRVVRNHALSSARTSRRRRRREEVAARQAWFRPTHDDAIDAQAAADALQTLPTEQREIVTAHLWGGLTFQQIGELIGASDSTAHRRYREALRDLRDLIGETCQTRKPTTK